MNRHFSDRKNSGSRIGIGALASCFAAVALMAANFTLAAQAQVQKGTILIPKSSIPNPKDNGVRAHTNFEVLVGVPGHKVGPFGGGGPGGGYTPAQIRQAYSLPSTGGSQIIAIVDAYDNPNALADFNVFAKQYGLPIETSASATASTNQVFQVLYAGGAQPPVDPIGDWEFEESLDVQWAHAMAPNAKIVLVEANSNSFVDLYAAEAAATNLIDGNGLVPLEVSNSWGSGEYDGEQANDIYFTSPNMVYFASTGDSGAPAGYPSTSPYVVAAGGTTLVLDNNNNVISETGWSGGGGGPSALEPTPFYQASIAGMLNGWRGTPDISFVADPNTGVSVYDSYPFEGIVFGWAVVGGTSVSSPALAGIANTAGTAQGPLPAGSQDLLTTIYNNLGTNNFTDIIAGNNGFQAGVGWDFVTGVGTCVGLGGLQPVGAFGAFPQSLFTPLGTPVSITLKGQDLLQSPPPPLTFALASQPTSGTLTGFNAVTGAVTYTPNFGFQGVDTFTFTITDGVMISRAATVTIVVTPGTPTANSQTVQVDLGVSTAITLTGSDIDRPPLPLTFTILSPPSNGILTPLNDGTGQLRYIPNIFFKGQDSFTFVVFNGYVESAPATVTLIVGVGTPIANPQTADVQLNTATGLTLTGTDPELPPQPLTFAIASSPSNGALSGLNTSTGAVTYTPNNGYFGKDTFTFTVNNGKSTSAPATVTLLVGPQTPTASSQTVAVPHNTAEAITLTGTDPDSPPLPLTFALASGPAHGALGSLNTTTGAVTYTPSANYHGADSFTFTVNNGFETSAPATVTLGVAVGVPTANPQTVTITSSSAAITLTGSDPENPSLALTFAIASSPSNGTLSGLNTSTGAVTYTPSGSFRGSDSFTFTVSNGTNTSAPATVSIAAPIGVSSLVIAPTTVVGGASAKGTVTINQPAPTGGTVVNLSSSSGTASPPASVTVTAGATSAQFTITTSAVSKTTPTTIAASIGSSSSNATLTVTPLALVSVSVSPATVAGGGTSTGTVTLNGPAGTGGTVISLSSSASAASVPGSVTIPAGQSSATFTVGTIVVSTQTTATITAKLGTASQTASLTITAPSVISVSLSPASVVGGKSSTGTVTLSAAAPAGGIVVSLSSSSASAGVPASVTVASGKTTATFTVTTKTVKAQTTATITAKAGSSTQSATLTITK